MAQDVLRKKYYDLASELYEITSQLVVKAEVDSSQLPSAVRMKAYVEWSKTNLEPLEDAIEKLVQRVRDDTKAGRQVFTRAEQAELNAKYEEMRKRRREQEQVGGDPGSVM
jgi:hypothetical protein